MSNFRSEGVGFWCLRLWKRTQEKDELWVLGFLREVSQGKKNSSILFCLMGLYTQQFKYKITS